MTLLNAKPSTIGSRLGDFLTHATRRTTFIFAILLAALVGVVALMQYAHYDPSTDNRTTVNFSKHPIAIVMHAVGASFAPQLGLLQFSTRLRRRWPAWHCWAGRLYLVSGVAVGGTAALWLSFFAYGGTVVRTGMSVVAIFWLLSSAIAYAALRSRDVNAHRRWMLRSVSLALGAVTLRVYLPLLSMANVDFLTAYRIAAWGSWLPNLLVAEVILYAERASVNE